ncbi:MAG: hypothetical protein R3B67_02185 [Phycisphaerales bacterium]
MKPFQRITADEAGLVRPAEQLEFLAESIDLSSQRLWACTRRDEQHNPEATDDKHEEQVAKSFGVADTLHKTKKAEEKRNRKKQHPDGFREEHILHGLPLKLPHDLVPAIVAIEQLGGERLDARHFVRVAAIILDLHDPTSTQRRIRDKPYNHPPRVRTR